MPTAMKYLPDIDTPSVPNLPDNNYIVVNSFYLKFPLLLHVLSVRAHNYVAGFILDPRLTPLGRVPQRKRDKNGHLLGFAPHKYYSIFDPFINICTLFKSTLLY